MDHLAATDSDRVAIMFDNSSPPGQDGRHFAHDIFRCIFLNEKFCILNLISMNFVPKGLMDNKLSLVQAMVWRRIGDRPLPEPMLPQFIVAYMWY